jgi:hypothetical protein
MFSVAKAVKVFDKFLGRIVRVTFFMKELQNLSICKVFIGPVRT